MLGASYSHGVAPIHQFKYSYSITKKRENDNYLLIYGFERGNIAATFRLNMTVVTGSLKSLRSPFYPNESRTNIRWYTYDSGKRGKREER